MKVKIQLFGASRDFSNKNYLDFDVGKNSTIKDIRNKLINYLEEEFHGNENYKKIVNIIYVGRLSREKGIFVILNALKNLNKKYPIKNLDFPNKYYKSDISFKY